MITYEERLSRIKQESDIDMQIISAAAYAKSLNTQSKNTRLSLAQKIEVKTKSKVAADIAQKLRLNYFKIADSLPTLSH